MSLIIPMGFNKLREEINLKNILELMRDVFKRRDLAFVQKLLDAIGPANFPAPLSAFIDVADRLTWISNGSGTTRRGMR